jgi:hypothetical protein
VYEDKLSDEVIRELWAQHFPKRLDDVISKTLCLAFCLIVERRAADNVIADENLLVQVHRTLNSLGIPRDEFYPVEKEKPRPSKSRIRTDYRRADPNTFNSPVPRQSTCAGNIRG